MSEFTDLVNKLSAEYEKLKWDLQPKEYPFINLLNESQPNWLGKIILDYLTDFDGEWDFEKDGPLGVIEVVKQDIK